MFKLIKASSPGWEKNFPSKDAARVELLKHICAACLAGGEWEGFDDNGITQGIINAENPPDRNNISDLLGTPCGCEFWLESHQSRGWRKHERQRKAANRV